MSKKLLQHVLHDNGYQFSPIVQSQFIQYMDLLEQWNRVYNLTAIVERDQVIYLHLLDSLSVNPYLNGNTILDVGTGAGLPGIPLALINPDKKFMLLDSNNKKIRFLRHVVQELELNNVEVMHARCESFCSESCFDTIISRAFASIKLMLASTEHLICKDGQFLAMKGVYPEAEMREISDEFGIVGVHELKIKGLDAARCLVVIHKNS